MIDHAFPKGNGKMRANERDMEGVCEPGVVPPVDRSAPSSVPLLRLFTAKQPKDQDSVGLRTSVARLAFTQLLASVVSGGHELVKRNTSE